MNKPIVVNSELEFVLVGPVWTEHGILVKSESTGSDLIGFANIIYKSINSIASSSFLKILKDHHIHFIVSDPLAIGLSNRDTQLLLCWKNRNQSSANNYHLIIKEFYAFIDNSLNVLDRRSSTNYYKQYTDSSRIDILNQQDQNSIEWTISPLLLHCLHTQDTKWLSPTPKLGDVDTLSIIERKVLRIQNLIDDATNLLDRRIEDYDIKIPIELDNFLEDKAKIHKNENSNSQEIIVYYGWRGINRMMDLLSLFNPDLRLFPMSDHEHLYLFHENEHHFSSLVNDIKYYLSTLSGQIKSVLGLSKEAYSELVFIFDYYFSHFYFFDLFKNLGRITDKLILFSRERKYDFSSLLRFGKAASKLNSFIVDVFDELYLPTGRKRRY